MLDSFISRLPAQTLISLLLGVFFFIGAVLLMLFFNVGNIASVLVWSFVFGAVVYLVIDFYETFGED